MHLLRPVLKLHSSTTLAQSTLLVASCCTLLLYSSSTLADIQSQCSRYRQITFGILPFVSAEQLVTRFTPLAQYLTKNLHVPVRLETAPNFVEFARRTHEDQRYDILFTAPHFYPQANSKAGYRLIASVDSPNMWAVVVAPKSSEIHKVEDLTGKRLATVHPMGLATLLVRKYLVENGIDPDTDLTMITTPTHDASLLSTYHGVTDASVLMLPPFMAASRQVHNSMRIIIETDSTPQIPISVSPKINETCAAEISKLMLSMSSTDEGKSILKHNQLSGFRPAQTEEYERVRDLLVP